MSTPAARTRNRRAGASSSPVILVQDDTTKIVKGTKKKAFSTPASQQESDQEEINALKAQLLSVQQALQTVLEEGWYLYQRWSHSLLPHLPNRNFLIHNDHSFLRPGRLEEAQLHRSLHLHQLVRRGAQ
jgi:hypothetical protein